MIDPEIINTAAYILAYAIIAIIPAHLAATKGRSFAAWWVGGFILWPVALVAAIIVSLSDPEPNRQAKQPETLPGTDTAASPATGSAVSASVPESDDDPSIVSNLALDLSEQDIGRLPAGSTIYRAQNGVIALLPNGTVRAGVPAKTFTSAVDYRDAVQDGGHWEERGV